MATRMALRLLVGAGTVAASTLSPPLLDTITFAQPDARHKLQSTNASIELHPHATPDCQSALALNRRRAAASSSTCRSRRPSRRTSP